MGVPPGWTVRVLAFLLALLLAGCLSEATTSPPPVEERETDDAALRPLAATFTGRATASPATPYEERFPFDVPRGAVGVNGTLVHPQPPVEIPLRAARPLTLELVDPSGETVSTGYADVEGRLIVATVDPPRAGTWTFVVRSSAAAGVDYTLDAVAELIVPADNVVTKSLRLGPASFYEVNLILEEAASFTFSFNASAPVRWDVHSHPPEGLKTWDEGEAASGGASFTAPHRDVYSILWENPAPLPVDLAFHVEGRFRTHSHSG